MPKQDPKRTPTKSLSRTLWNAYRISGIAENRPQLLFITKNKPQTQQTTHTTQTAPRAFQKRTRPSNTLDNTTQTALKKAHEEPHAMRNTSTPAGQPQPSQTVTQHSTQQMCDVAFQKIGPTNPKNSPRHAGRRLFPRFKNTCKAPPLRTRLPRIFLQGVGGYISNFIGGFSQIFHVFFSILC